MNSIPTEKLTKILDELLDEEKLIKEKIYADNGKHLFKYIPTGDKTLAELVTEKLEEDKNE